jgi:dolichyl-diphosphooligosaccharide--protein glycosyltransferase
MAESTLTRTLSLIAVILSCLLSFLIRQFANVMYEPLIHEFDPHFNWRCTQYIYEHGVYEFMGWFDNISWYPQGRPVGETSYPGLMITSVLLKRLLDKLHVIVDLSDICIYMGPSSSVLSVLLAFIFGHLVDGSLLGVIWAGLTSFAPGMISRSVGGAYDYECLALFVIVLCFYTFARALKTGSILWATAAGFVYGYLSLVWGGYVFVSNCIPLFTAALVAIGQYSWRLHIAYSFWAVFGTILNSSIPFISEKVLTKPEHFALLGVFVVLQLWGLFTAIRRQLSGPSYSTVVVSSIMFLPLLLICIAVVISTGLLGGFSGRLLQMFDPSYASKKIPIIASVAEHQPTAWPKYFLECGFFVLLFPVGCYVIVTASPPVMPEVEFLLMIYGLSTLYFASIMVRLVLVFTPACVFVAGFGFHHLVKRIARRTSDWLFSGILMATLFVGCWYTCLQAVYFACNSFSGTRLHFPALSPRGQEGADDYREGYRWLWANTNRDARVMSWWDYGYQISSFGGRACHADGNTNNFTHIGIIGMTMSSPPAVSWRLARMMEADYMLVIFGGASQYSGDDVNKFLWMPRIAHQTFDNVTGDMYTPPGAFIVGEKMTENMTGAAIFSFWYHNFARYVMSPQLGAGFDLARRTKVPGIEKIKLHHFQEAFTTKHWIMRIYRVMPDPIWSRVY